MKPLLFVSTLATLLVAVLGARILAILPFPAKSHFNFFQGVLSALAARGHHVTVYSPFEPPQPVPNMKHMVVHTLQEKVLQETVESQVFTDFFNDRLYFGMHAVRLWHFSSVFCEEFLEHEEIKKLLASNEIFDLVMVEARGLESLTVFGHFFKAPVINLNSIHPWSVTNRMHGNTLQMAYAPDTYSFPFSDKMSFIERFRNVVSTLGTLAMFYLSHLPKHQSLIDRVFQDPSIPPLEQMLTNISLTLANFHPTVGYPLSYTSNIVPVAGVHFPAHLPPLPKDIETFLEREKNYGVILFSLGSIVPTHLMPPEYMKIFTNVFRKLPYKILWKIEVDTVPDIPNNVMISKWLPQQTVLAHPNCVLFITHGGVFSQLEAFNAGVPVVGIPFFGDQYFNVKQYEALGVGAKLDFTTLTEESMYKVITSVVGKPEYIKNAKQVSTLFQHRAMSPADTAVYWTEYVLRHGGARHLRPASAHMPLYQLYLLDILGALLLMLVVLLLLICVLFLFVCKLYWTKRSKKETFSRNKKKN